MIKFNVFFLKALYPGLELTEAFMRQRLQKCQINQLGFLLFEFNNSNRTLRDPTDHNISNVIT